MGERLLSLIYNKQTKQTNFIMTSQIDRMSNAVDAMNTPVEVNVNAISKEERKLILTRINQIANRNNTTTQDVLNYIDQIANVMAA